MGRLAIRYDFLFPFVRLGWETIGDAAIRRTGAAIHSGATEHRCAVEGQAIGFLGPGG